MSATIVATVTVTDPAGFKAYGEKTKGLAEEHGGEYVVRGGVEAFLEGVGNPDERVVVVRFPDEASARAYVDDPRYREGQKLREGAGQVCMRLILG